MAPFSRLCTLAFAVCGGVTNTRIRKRAVEKGWEYRDDLSQGRDQQHSEKFIASLAAPSDVSEDSLPSFEPPTTTVDLVQLSELLGATPTDLIRLETSEDGVRGVYVNRDICRNDVLLSIPLNSCLRDDTPPTWFLKTHDEDDSPALQPNAWATRLAASLIDKQLELSPSSTMGMDLWLQLLPDANLLRASLPIHWNEELLSSARCTALELAVDSAYFTRADAIADLTMALLENGNEDMKEVCDNALDLVQTRSCRVETSDGTLIRLMAPIFDFINHGNTPNAGFALEYESLVARATTDLSADEQVFIDYGDSARPHWKCLASYGFVPEYSEHDEDGNVAEVYVHGKRFEVGPSTIPVDLVETIEALAISEGHYGPRDVEKEPETLLTPDIATRLSNRLCEVAYQLLLSPTSGDEELAAMYEDAVDENDKQEENLPQDLVSAQLAASLRFAQHRTLLACARGLVDLAEGNCIARMRGEV